MDSMNGNSTIVEVIQLSWFQLFNGLRILIIATPFMGVDWVQLHSLHL
jgi:hypothetical protein